MRALFRALICVFTCPLVSTVSETSEETETCTLGDHHYLVGETWHPKLLPFGENACVNCTCVARGDVKCTGVDCPKPECDEPRIVRGQCCPSCTVLSEDNKNGAAEQYPGCEFHGSRYEDGDIFPSNKTALKPKHNNQCVLCSCYRGDIICHLKTCLPSPKCRRTMKVDDDCCLQCEEVPNLPDLSRTLSDNMNYSLEEGDCLPATGRQKNGTTWKPIIGQYGEMKCIVCTCINGQINCGRLQCQKESNLKCNTSKLDPGGCCKQCLGESKQNAQTPRGRITCRQNSMDRNIEKDCKRKAKSARNKRNRNKNTKGKSKLVFQAEMHLYEALPKLCIPHKTQHLVYHTKKNDYESLTFDWQNSNKMEHIFWTVKKGRLQSTERRFILEPEAYRKNVTVADILGVVQTKEVKKFFKRLERIQQGCKKKCKRKLLDKAIKKLKVQELDLTKSCNASATVT